jgi:hypothetical protein
MCGGGPLIFMQGIDERGVIRRNGLRTAANHC